MARRYIWKQLIVKQDQVADLITTRGIQPGQFVITDAGHKKVLLVYVDKVIQNVE